MYSPCLYELLSKEKSTLITKQEKACPSMFEGSLSKEKST